MAQPRADQRHDARRQIGIQAATVAVREVVAYSVIMGLSDE